MERDMGSGLLNIVMEDFMKETSTMIRKVAMGMNPMRTIFFIGDISKTTSGTAWEFFSVRKNRYFRDTG